MAFFFFFFLTAYLFADKGFDVWLTNVRGGDYSRNHTHLSPSSKEFWDFSWDEMAKYDLPKMIDYIVKHTKHKKVDYVGHSMGKYYYATFCSQ
ncbi:Lipase member K, partial [Armadillidium vulgare]